VELLSYIFQLGVQMDESAESDDYNNDDEEDISPVPFAILVSHVCRHWRAVAITTAKLVCICTSDPSFVT
jgi:hypothetical protein